jgi:hypothetical protein
VRATFLFTDIIESTRVAAASETIAGEISLSGTTPFERGTSRAAAYLTRGARPVITET